MGICEKFEMNLANVEYPKAIINIITNDFPYLNDFLKRLKINFLMICFGKFLISRLNNSINNI
jgi:hypothetical protein